MRKPAFHKSMANALRGLVWILRNERNFQLEILALLINLFLIVLLKLSTTDAALILIVCAMVLSLEIVNTCIEKLCDMLQPEYDLRIKIIKDVAAAAVVLMAIFAVVVALLIYPQYIFS